MGGLYKAHQERHSFPQITSHASPSGWTLCPHIEISSPCYVGSKALFVVDPFVMADWANSWQYHFQESGSSGFNIELNNRYFSLLRSEIGIRFYEILQYGWGRLIFEEKGSYVNKVPFHAETSQASFIGAFSSFSVETFSRSMQNLGVIQIQMECIPSNLRWVYGSVGYQGEFGRSSQSQMIELEVGKRF